MEEYSRLPEDDPTGHLGVSGGQEKTVLAAGGGGIGGDTAATYHQRQHQHQRPLLLHHGGGGGGATGLFAATGAPAANTTSAAANTTSAATTRNRRGGIEGGRGRDGRLVMPSQRVVGKPVVKPGKPIAPGQPPPQYRVKDRFVSLPDEVQGQSRLSDEFLTQDRGVPTIFDDLEQGSEVRGRITSYCVAESLDRKELVEGLRMKKIATQSYPEVVYARHESMTDDGRLSYADVFYFDYGVVVTWNMSLQEERALLRSMFATFVDPLPGTEVEVDEFLFHYTLSEKPHIQNDTFTINYRHAGDHLLKMSVSHAIAQSTKLSVYEFRVVAIVEETKDLPEILAASGKVKMSRKKIAQLMGRVFLERCNLSLSSSALDTPDFFWDQPDSMQSLYERCTEYLEYENRVEVLNSRFQVLQEMLDMLRDHQNNDHTARLEWIVIWLILVEIVIGVFECMGIFGLAGNKAE